MIKCLIFKSIFGASLRSVSNTHKSSLYLWVLLTSLRSGYPALIPLRYIQTTLSIPKPILL